MIIFNCPTCGKEFKSKDEDEGKQFNCTSCGAAGRVPELAGIKAQRAAEKVGTSGAEIAGSPVPKSRFSFHCPHCNTLIKVAVEAIGKKAKCRSCGQTIQFTDTIRPNLVVNLDEESEVASLPANGPEMPQTELAPPAGLVFFGLVILAIPLLPFFAGYSHKVVAFTAIPCVLAAVGFWLVAWMVAFHPDQVRQSIKVSQARKEQAKLEEEQARLEQAKQRAIAARSQYKRTCKACGKVWHSSVARESAMNTKLLGNSLMAVGSALTLSTSTSLQANRNLDANQTEFDALRKCPNCFSTQYEEVVVDYDSPSVNTSSE